MTEPSLWYPISYIGLGKNCHDFDNQTNCLQYFLFYLSDLKTPIFFKVFYNQHYITNYHNVFETCFCPNCPFRFKFVKILIISSFFMFL